MEGLLALVELAVGEEDEDRHILEITPVVVLDYNPFLVQYLAVDPGRNFDVELLEVVCEDRGEVVGSLSRK